MTGGHFCRVTTSASRSACDIVCADRNFAWTPWSAFRLVLSRRRYDAVPNSVDVESSSASRDSGFEDEPPSTTDVEQIDASSSPTAAAAIDAQEEVEISNASEPIPESSQAWTDGSMPTPSGALRAYSTSNSGASSEKICLICLEPLTHEEFENGEAIRLECQCKGDAALRHRECAQKWVDVKGDLTCDVCQCRIANLNAPRPRSDAGSQQPSDDQTDASRGRYPSATDVFDCIRMTWVVTIVCILFFHANIVYALITGLLIAVMYTWSCQLLRCAQFHTGQNGPNGQDTENGDHMATDERHENMPIQAVPAIVIV